LFDPPAYQIKYNASSFREVPGTPTKPRFVQYWPWNPPFSSEYTAKEYAPETGWTESSRI
jgi:hypothetical protein